MRQISRLFIFIHLMLFIPAKGFAQPAGRQQRLEAIMNSYHRLGLFNGSISITKKGRTIFRQSCGYADATSKRKNSAGTKFNIYSITKSFTATVILKLVAEKQITLEQKLSAYYPSLPGSDTITIRHLVTHTSGIYNYNNDFTMPVGSEAEMIAWLEKKPLDFVPGSRFRYSNTGYFLLGFIIEKTTGMSYEEAVQKHILLPLGMKNSGFDLRKPSTSKKAKGYTHINNRQNEEATVWDYRELYSAGGMYSTADDLQCFHRAMQNGNLLPDSLIRSACTPYRKNYGLGWFIDTIKGQRIISHSGGATGFRSYLIRDTENDICIVLLCNSETSDIIAIRNKLLDELNGRNYTLPENVDAGKLYQFEGAYKLTPSLIIYIHRDKGLLMATTNRRGSMALMPEGKNVFQIEAINARLLFKQTAAGAYDTLVFSQKGETVTAVRLKAAWGITGDAVPNGWDGPDILMHYENKKWVAEKILLKEGVIKFRYNNDWVLNLGRGPHGHLSNGGGDIKIAAGVYTIILDMTDTDKIKLEIVKE